MRRVCPACARRTSELVSPDCAVCRGDGFLTLHPAALAIYEPAVVAEAVALALEAAARVIEGQTTLSDDRQAVLAGKVRDLVAARIIQSPGQLKAMPRHEHIVAGPRRRKHQSANQISFTESPEIVAEAVTGEPSKSYDSAVLAAKPHRYKTKDRPLMRGLPILSADGHPSHLARVTDPQDAYTDTPQDCADRARRTRQAKVVVATVPLVLAERSKRA